MLFLLVLWRWRPISRVLDLEVHRAIYVVPNNMQKERVYRFRTTLFTQHYYTFAGERHMILVRKLPDGSDIR